jgi:hypothetical protein
MKHTESWRFSHHPPIPGKPCSDCTKVRVCKRSKNIAWVLIPSAHQRDLDDIVCHHFEFREKGAPRFGELGYGPPRMGLDARIERDDFKVDDTKLGVSTLIEEAKKEKEEPK